jgi:hypothetical protein
MKLTGTGQPINGAGGLAQAPVSLLREPVSRMAAPRHKG